MKKISLTQGKYTLVDDQDYNSLSQFRWHYANGKAVRCEKGKTIFMHREIMNTPKGMDTDHINHLKLDNRRCNLRICTRGENQMNRRKFINNTSGYKGVSWHKATGRWQANIRKNYKLKCIGYFENVLDAAKAYDESAKSLHGEFAAVNREGI